MAICLVLIALHLVPNLDFSDLSFLGIKPGFDPDRARKIIVWALWVLWAYHAFLFFIYYAPRDFKDWKFDLLRSNGKFTELPMPHPAKRKFDQTGIRTLGTNRTMALETLFHAGVGGMDVPLRCGKRYTVHARKGHRQISAQPRLLVCGY